MYFQLKFCYFLLSILRLGPHTIATDSIIKGGHTVKKNEFTLEIDGRRVVVDQSTQEVSILDEHGDVIFRDRIQVAAGSVQGLFDSVSSAVKDVANINPANRD